MLDRIESILELINGEVNYYGQSIILQNDNTGWFGISNRKRRLKSCKDYRILEIDFNDPVKSISATQRNLKFIKIRLQKKYRKKVSIIENSKTKSEDSIIDSNRK